jgi:hypothetical protein
LFPAQPETSPERARILRGWHLSIVILCRRRAFRCICSYC